MTSININIIGAGRLGKTLVYSLLHNNLINLDAVCNTTLASAQAAACLLNTGKPISSFTELKHVDLLLITVPDDQITIITTALAKQRLIKPGTVVIHCSGVLSSAILAPLAQQGCYTASVHPLKVFTGTTLNPNAFYDCYCAVEGSSKAISYITPLFKALGAILVDINPEQKTIYHAAAVIASNYLVTLAATGTQLFKDAGIDTALAPRVIQQLMQSSLDAMAKASSPKDALTGPLARGDINTLNLHLNALHNPSIQQLYCAAARATLPWTTLTETQLTVIKELLGE